MTIAVIPDAPATGTLMFSSIRTRPYETVELGQSFNRRVKLPGRNQVLPIPMDRQLQFENAVRDHQRMVFRTLARLLGRSDHIEDLAQEVFLRLFRAYDQFRNEAKLSTYIYKIVLNVAHDEWKRRRTQRESICSLSDESHPWGDRLPHHGKSPEQLVQEMEAQLEIERALQTLSEQERAVLVLFHQEERTYEAIAHILSIPIGTVRTHLHRGRTKLRDAIRRRAASCRAK